VDVRSSLDIAAVERARPVGAEPVDKDSLISELREELAMFVAAQRLAKLASWSIELPSKKLRWSQEAHRVFGFQRDEFQQLTVERYMACLPGHDRSYVEELLGRHYAGAFNSTWVHRFIAPNGDERWLRGEAQSQLDAQGEVTRVVGTVMDVTEQERGRKELELRDSRLRTLADDSRVWFWEQDAELRYTAFTATTEQQHNLRHAAALGRHRWELPDSEPRSGTWDDHMEVLRARRAFRDFQYRTGEVYLSTTGIPVWNADGDFQGYRGTAYDITELKAVQERAAQQETLLRMASRLGRLGAWVIELPQRMPAWTPELLAIYELEPDALLCKKTLLELACPQWRPALENALTAVADGGVPIELEFQSNTAKGRTVWLHLMAEARRDGNGRISRIKGVVQDITERRERDIRMRQLNDELLTTLESMSDAFFTLDAELRLTYANGEGEHLLGMRRNEMLGRYLADTFPAYVGSPFEREYKRALTDRTTGRLEAYYPPLNKWMSVSVYPSAQGLAVFARDVTQGKKAHEALVASEERFRLLFETSADAIFSSSLAGNIVRANRAACSMFRRSAQELTALTRFDLVAPGEPRQQQMQDERVVTGTSHGELKMMRGDGSVFDAEVDVSTYRNSDGAPCVSMVVRDATERIQMREKLLRLNEELAAGVRERTAELEQANQDLKSYARSLAHDLRQPLAGAKAFCFALGAALDAQDVPSARKYATQLSNATHLMGGYIDALLCLVRVSQAPLTFEEVDLSAMASSLLLELSAQDPSRKVVTSVEPNLYAVGDASLLRMLLQNLLGNAWKFTSLREVAHIAFTASTQSGGELVYSVRDDGAGFDSTQAERLFTQFERFHRHSEFPGLGIGLANAHRIVTRHGGRIWAESRVNEGATFNFTLAGLSV
jgi:PAS domain S-box-containing protein